MKLLNNWVQSTEPAVYTRAKWRALLKGGRVGPMGPMGIVPRAETATTA